MIENQKGKTFRERFAYEWGFAKNVFLKVVNIHFLYYLLYVPSLLVWVNDLTVKPIFPPDCLHTQWLDVLSFFLNIFSLLDLVSVDWYKKCWKRNHRRTCGQHPKLDLNPRHLVESHLQVLNIPSSFTLGASIVTPGCVLPVRTPFSPVQSTQETSRPNQCCPLFFWIFNIRKT